jgi:hypothetical protein
MGAQWHMLPQSYPTTKRFTVAFRRGVEMKFCGVSAATVILLPISLGWLATDASAIRPVRLNSSHQPDLYSRDQ